MKRFRCILTSLLLACALTRAQAPATTTVADTLYRADGTPAGGTLVISWPAFTSNDGHAITAGTRTVKLAADGSLSIGLIPTENSDPPSHYSVVVKLSDGTTHAEYWNVPLLSPASVSAIRSQLMPANVAVQWASRAYVDAALAGVNAGPDMSVRNLNGVRLADQFPGATGNDKLLAAAADLGSTNGLVIAPHTLGGNYGARPASRATILDLRGVYADVFAASPAVDSSRYNGIFWHQYLNENPAAYANTQHWIVSGIYQESMRGGRNTWTGGGNYDKRNFEVLNIGMNSYTDGQHSPLNVLAMSGGRGDLLATTSLAYHYGACNAGGDECAKAFAGRVYRNDVEFAATLTAVSGNVLTYGSSSNFYARGENRLLINETTGKYSTGTVSGITTSVPATVTGSGTGWVAATGGTGSKANWCFELANGNTYNSRKYIWKVASIESDTQLTLFSQFQTTEGTNSVVWRGDSSTGSYTLYRCSLTTEIGPHDGASNSGAITVADGSVFHAADAVRLAGAHEGYLTGISLDLRSDLPSPQAANHGFSANNGGTRPLDNAVSVSGPWNFGFRSTGNLGAGFMFNGQVGANGAGPLIDYSPSSSPSNQTILALRVPRNASGNAGLMFYQGAGGTDLGQWQFTGNLLVDNNNKGTSLALFTANNGGIPRFYVSNTDTFINNGYALRGNSGNQSGETWSITSSTGAAVFTGGVTANVTGTATGNQPLNSVLTTLATPGASGTAPVSNGSTYVHTDVATQSELDAVSNALNAHLSVPSGSKLLTYQKATGAVTGNGAEQDVYSYALPGGTLHAGECLEIKAWHQKSGTNTATYKLYFGATVITQFGGTSTEVLYTSALVCNDPAGVTTQQTMLQGSVNLNSGGTPAFLTPTGVFTTPAENTANNVTIHLTQNVASSSSITGKAFSIELKR